MAFFSNLKRELNQNIREYGMFIALFAIVIVFSITTGGIFISARNIGNLLNQTGYIAVLAVGMTLVIVIRHIDLSVGFLSGFVGAVSAVALSIWGLPVWLVIPMALLMGMLAGLLTGFMVAKLAIPAFVASLAGFLIYRGAILLVTSGTGAIIINDATFNALGNGYIPDLPLAGLLPGFHSLTLLAGLCAICLYIWMELKTRRVRRSYSFEVLSLDMFIAKLVSISVLIGYFCWVMSRFNGISWTVVIVFVVVAVYHFITTRTVLGRHIYALGGNPEAAALSGIRVKRITYFVFGSMGMLSALGGILYASRLKSATTTAGTLLELDAIAAAYIGGVSAAGGVGKVTGSIIGALVMTSLTSGMNLMKMDISLQYIVRGLILALAVIFDVATRKKSR